MTIRIDGKKDGHLKPHHTYHNIDANTIEIVSGKLFFSHWTSGQHYRIDIDQIDRLTMTEDES